ncbi:MAG: PEP-CTERM sorting domain-containing protein [Hydrogenophilales bacterium]|nr:PEP-CTERM sorting domain-containing protein [Hydrogenophilales bacterium]
MLKLAALALLSGLSIVNTAQADTTYNMGTLSTTPYVNAATVTAGSVFTLPSTGTTQYNFTDTYNFSVPNSLVASTAVTVDLSLGNLSFDISNLKLDLFAGSTWLAGDMVTGSSDVSVSVASPVTAGSYYFLVRGFADGIGTNQGIYTFTAAAVPEADTYAMMLAGLGLIGYTVSRRKRS